jgi:hypothetical protein
MVMPGVSFVMTACACLAAYVASHIQDQAILRQALSHTGLVS